MKNLKVLLIVSIILLTIGVSFIPTNKWVIDNYCARNTFKDCNSFCVKVGYITLGEEYCSDLIHTLRISLKEIWSVCMDGSYESCIEYCEDHKTLPSDTYCNGFKENQGQWRID